MSDASAPHSPSAVYDRTLIGRLDRRVGPGRGPRVFLVVVCVVIFAAASIKFVRNFQTLEESPFRGSKRKTAIGRWLPDPVALWNNGEPYGPGHWFPCTPLVLVALTPLSYMPPEAACATWLAAKFIALVLTVWLMLRAMRPRGDVVPLGILFIAAVFAARPIVGDIQHGNLNIFVLCEIAAAWYLFVHRRDTAAGIVLALAIATKVTPALLLVYFLYKRCWRLVFACGIGLILFFVVVPGLFTGFGRNIELLTAWIHMMVVPYTVEGWITVQPMNQSLPGMLMKWFAAPELLPMNWPNLSLGSLGETLRTLFPVRVTGMVETTATGLPPLDLFNHLWAWFEAMSIPLRTGMPLMARPEALLPAAVLRGASLVIIVLLAWSCRTPTTDRRDPRLLVELGVVLVAMLLLSERTWKHHMVTLLIVFLGTWQYLTHHPWSARFRAIFVIGLAVQLVGLQASGSIAEYTSVITLAVILCLVQNVVLLRAGRTAPAEAGASP